MNNDKTVVAPNDPEINTCGGERVKEKPARMPEEYPAPVVQPERVEQDSVFAPHVVEVAR